MSIAFHPIIPSLIVAGTFNGKFTKFYTLRSFTLFYKSRAKHVVPSPVIQGVSKKR
jgi:hypothetical protein